MKSFVFGFMTYIAPWRRHEFPFDYAYEVCPFGETLGATAACFSVALIVMALLLAGLLAADLVGII